MTQQCVILVGGLGSRLGELTRAIPKPLLPIAGRPFLDVLVSEAVRRGFTRFVFLAGHAWNEIAIFSRTLADRYGDDFSFTLSVEPEPAGTGGALIHALPLLEDRFLLLNGDTWSDFNWLDLVVRAQARDASMIATRLARSAERYESFEIAPDGLISTIMPRCLGKEPALINSGVYALRKADLRNFTGKVSLEGTILPALVEAGRLFAHSYDGFFIDIGVPATYGAGQHEIPARLVRGAIFLDRDGVLNHDDHYVHRPEQVRWIKGAQAAVKRANDLGLYVFVVTNQAGVARGYYDEESVQSLHRWMTEQFRVVGAHIDDWRYCPYHPDGIVGTYRVEHSWRKPAPGMLLDLMARWPVDAAKSLMIGDQASDMAAAHAAGIPGARFLGGDLNNFFDHQFARYAAS